MVPGAFPLNIHLFLHSLYLLSFSSVLCMTFAKRDGRPDGASFETLFLSVSVFECVYMRRPFLVRVAVERRRKLPLDFYGQITQSKTQRYTHRRFIIADVFPSLGTNIYFFFLLCLEFIEMVPYALGKYGDCQKLSSPRFCSGKKFIDGKSAKDFSCFTGINSVQSCTGYTLRINVDFPIE